MFTRWPASSLPGQLLLVEDDDLDARIVSRGLEKTAPGAFHVTRVTTWREARSQLAQNQFDAVLTDLGLPDKRGLDVVRDALEAAPSIPLIIMTGNDDGEIAVEALHMGAQDFVVKGEAGDRALLRIVRHAVERRRVLDQLLESHLENNRIQDEFISHVSHELRTPLTAIHQFVTILQDGIAGDLKPEQREYLDIVYRNVNQLRDMIGDLMEVSRAQTGKLRIDPRRIGLANLAQEVVDSFRASAKDKEVELTFEFESHPAWVLADGVRIRQVMGNLITNALKFTRPRGSVTVRVSPTPEGFAVSVEDTGIGIPQEDCQRIFLRLYQASNGNGDARQGLGLGLYICKEIVGQHGGHIAVESEAGRGSVFRFTLPAFSIENLIRPVYDSAPDGPFTLICARLDMDPEKSGRLADTDLESIYQLLVSNVMGGIDVVLPRNGWDGQGESYFIVAGADQTGASAMIRRVERQVAYSGLTAHPAIRFQMRAIPIQLHGAHDVLACLTERVGTLMSSNR